MNSILQITHVAIQYAGKTYSLPSPNRHHHVIRMIASENGVGIKGPDVQGFLNSAGNFMSRRGALQLAKDNGQLKRKNGPENYQGDELYSEDLW